MTTTEIPDYFAAETFAVPVDEETFWESRPNLTAIRDGAWARYASPWAVLGNILARLAVAQGPSLRLPGIIGGEASLNTFVAVVGPPGAGKGAARTAAREILALPEEPFTIPLGSGEGLVGVFVEPGSREEIDRDTGATLKVPCPRLIRSGAVAIVDEVDHLVAVGQGRAGSTIMSTLRQAWSGETFGRTAAARDRNLWVEGGLYSLGLVVGVQPLRAGPLLDEADGGTPQRFLWLPATDPRTPEHTAAPQPIQWRRRWTAADYGRPMGIPEAARNAVVQDRLCRIRGEETGLDGHALLARLKAAAGLALLDGRRDVSDEDWGLAQVIMQVSDRTRADVQKALAQRATVENERRARAAGHAELVKEEVIEARRLGQVRGVVLRKLTGEWVPRSTARKWVASKDRGHFETALLGLMAEGLLEVREAERGGQQIRRADR